MVRFEIFHDKSVAPSSFTSSKSPHNVSSYSIFFRFLLLYNAYTFNYNILMITPTGPLDRFAIAVTKTLSAARQVVVETANTQPTHSHLQHSADEHSTFSISFPLPSTPLLCILTPLLAIPLCHLTKFVSAVAGRPLRQLDILPNTLLTLDGSSQIVISLPSFIYSPIASSLPIPPHCALLFSTAHSSFWIWI